jgi:hypothetical protein
MLINVRWIDIPEDEIYEKFRPLGIKSWGIKTLLVAGFPRHYLFGEQYAYPYSLPMAVIDRLARRLNEAIDMTWYRKYNEMAIDWFDTNNEALNQAQEYWYQVGNPTLPKPEITPSAGLEDGDEYIAIVGLFHLPGSENGNNHHLFIDLIDEAGNRIYNNTPPLSLWYGWEGMTAEQQNEMRPVRIDKPGNEPGANIGLTWDQIVYGFHINNMATDRFRNIHTRYENDGPGNDRGHHSHYIVLQKRTYQSGTIPEPPDPEPEPPAQVQATIIVFANIDWLNTLPVDNQRNIVFEVKNEQGN